MHNHLIRKHKINLLKRVQHDDAEASCSNINTTTSVTNDTNSRSKISDYFNIIKTINDSFPAVLARLTARDCLSFKKICTSYDLQQLFKSKGYDCPKSPKTIKKIVMQYGDKIQKQIVTELSERIARGELFSLTFDEWTSLKNRRLMNVNVHSYDNVFWNLGLVRIKGSMPAEKCITYLQNTLKEFSIAIENIISIITDGAALMKKVGRLLDVNHQLCLAHGIQLSVIKVLYKRSVSDNISVENQEVAITEFEHGEDEEDDVMEDIGVFDVIEDTSTTDSSIQHESIGPIKTKIRKIVVMFRRSPTKNDILQKHVKDEFNKELALILDTKTRWSSMLIMLEKIYEIKNCVRKSQIRYRFIRK